MSVRHLSIVVLFLLASCAPAHPPTPQPSHTPQPIPPLTIENFQSDQNPFGGNTHCEAQNGATLQCARENNTLRLTYDKTSPSAYGSWWTELVGAGSDLSNQLMLVVRLRGEQGGERPHVYLVDQSGVRAFVEVVRYTDLTKEWQTITIPLADFQDKNGKRPVLSHLSELAVAFEFEKQQGSIAVGEIRAQATTVVGQLTRDVAREKNLTDAIQLPSGFKIAVYADPHLSEMTRIGFDPQGRFTFTRRNGQAYQIEGNQLKLIASGFSELLGFAWRGKELYLSSCHRVTRARDGDGDGFYEETTDLVTDLPCGGHQTNHLAFGPDGLLYIAQGEFNDQPGALLRINPDAPNAQPEVFATGLRNPYAFIFAPDGKLFATDNGPDDKDGPEEVNYIVQGGDYGFPKYFGDPPPNSGTIAPVVTFTQHAAAEGIAMVTGTQFPAEYRGDLFVALFGQLFTSNVVGHKLVRVKLTRDGDTYRGVASDFGTGFDRPLDVVVGPDGALYVNEFLTGVVYRITYQR